jgi:hypothetical protein
LQELIFGDMSEGTEIMLEIRGQQKYWWIGNVLKIQKLVSPFKEEIELNLSHSEISGVDISDSILLLENLAEHYCNLFYFDLIHHIHH